jgi:DNA-directed RNA polymerase subunit L
MDQTAELTSSVMDNNHKFRFTLKNIHVSTANAIRRTVLSDIPIYVFRTENNNVNGCKIQINTTRFHNEIVKQRLSCIPIHYPVEEEYLSGLNKREEPEKLLGSLKLLKYELELDESNKEDFSIKWVTSEQFKLRDKSTSQYLATEEVIKIFPADPISKNYIDILRLRPKIGNTIPGESIQLKADISICTAKENGMYNAVSICTFENKRDPDKLDKAWLSYSKQLEASDKTQEEKIFEEKNFRILQGDTYFVTNDKGEPNEFEFTIQSIGIYESNKIVQIACNVLIGKFRYLVDCINDDTLKIIPSDRIREGGEFRSVTESTIPNCYDIVLENEDYTVGCVLEHILYNMFYENEKTLSYVGFKKYHPHDTYSIVRFAYNKESNSLQRNAHIIQAATAAVQLFQSIASKINT